MIWPTCEAETQQLLAYRSDSGKLAQRLNSSFEAPSLTLVSRYRSARIEVGR